MKWLRPWDLHCTMIDTPARTSVVWTGNDALFERATVEKLLGEFFDVVGGAAAL